MRLYYSRVPSAAVRPMFDGNLYAYIPHRMGGDKVIEDYANPRMMLCTERTHFVRNGEAYVLFAKRGDALPVPFVPFGVSVVQVPDSAPVGEIQIEGV